MKMGPSLAAVALSLAFAPLATALAAQPAAASSAKNEKSADIEPQVRTTRHSGTFGGQRINYTATIGETLVRGANDKPEALVVTTSYVKEPRDPSRPVTFLFNGGPGSGS